MNGVPKNEREELISELESLGYDTMPGVQADWPDWRDRLSDEQLRSILANITAKPALMIGGAIMDLRDHFGGQALIGLVQADISGVQTEVSPDLLARTAYRMADAMIHARKPSPPIMKCLAQEAPELLRLLKRYRSETPLNHQPHMIADEADAVIARAEAMKEPSHAA